ncbi:DUF4920 domain-containing protein [Flavobacteriaceae bacterium D16]|nr:DUF4920 domain-containing protein [Flavobacteriaceae bacterium D16]
MKKFNILIGVLAVLVSCQSVEKKKQSEESVLETAEYASFGAEIQAEGAKSDLDMLAMYQQLPVSDSVNTKFSATVKEVCQSKGCWMKLKLQDGGEAMVRFKDYAFFVPKDISGKEVVVSGKAFVDMMTVEDQRHYAEDEGKSAEEIAAITEPKKTFSFEASGVLIKQ